MKIQKNFDVPFESEFDWRVSLLDHLHDFIIDAASDIISKYDESSEDLEWKDDEAILEFAQREQIIDKIASKVKNDIEKYFENLYS